MSLDLLEDQHDAYIKFQNDLQMKFANRGLNQ